MLLTPSVERSRRKVSASQTGDALGYDHCSDQPSSTIWPNSGTMTSALNLVSSVRTKLRETSASP